MCRQLLFCCLLLATGRALQAQADSLQAWSRQARPQIGAQGLAALDSVLAAGLRRCAQRTDSIYVYYRMGVHLRASQFYAPADSLLQLATGLAQGRDAYAGRAWLYRGLIAKVWQQPQTARAHYLRAVWHLSAFDDAANSRLLAYTYRVLGNLFTEEGDYEGSQSYLLASYQLASQLGNTSYQVQALMDLGLSSRFQQAWPEAALYYRRALKQASPPQLKAEIWHNLAELMLARGQLDSAEIYLLKSQAVFAEYPNSQDELAQSVAALGQVAFLRGAYSRAARQYGRALTLLQQVWGPRGRIQGKYCLSLGHISLNKQQPKQALRWYQQALAAVIDSLPPDSLLLQPAREQLYAENVIMDALYGKIQAYWALYGQDKDKIWLHAALQAAESLLEVEALLRKAQMEEASKLLSADERHRRTELVLAICHELELPARAFYFTEHSKAQVLQELMQPPHASGEGASAERRALMARLLPYRLQIQQLLATGDSIPAGLIHELIALRLQLDSLDIHSPPPAGVRDAAIPPFSLPGLQKELAADALLLSFFVGGENVYLFALTNDSLRYVRSAWQQQDSLELQAFLQSFYRPEGAGSAQQAVAAYSAAAYHWYQRLLAPVLEGFPAGHIRQLVVVPDRELAYLPFEALLTAPPADPASRYHQLPYLLRRYSLHYHFAARLLPARPASQHADRLFAGFAPAYGSGAVYSSSRSWKLVTQGGRSQLSPLNHNREEVQRLAALLHGQALLDSAATEARFFELAPHYRILHLSMHGFLHPAYPALSGLAFTRPTSSPAAGLPYDADGFVHAYELYGLQLQAQLVVLSACQTGVGQVGRGEGVMSMARAFHLAGCHNLLSSLWQVDDRATADLMEAFYEQVRQGRPLAEALRLAKLHYLNTHDKTHPYFWAAFVLSGQNEPIDLRPVRRRSAWWLAGGALLLLLGAWWWWALGRNGRKGKI